jgi:hypothetical protein
MKPLFILIILPPLYIKEFSLIFIKSSDSSNDKPFLNFSVISGADRILLSFVKLSLSPPIDKQSRYCFHI